MRGIHARTSLSPQCLMGVHRLVHGRCDLRERLCAIEPTKTGRW
jgi:hypothetical protein